MDIKYGRDGQPLPLEQQSEAAQAPLGNAPQPGSQGSQEGTKTFQVRETLIEGAPVDPHQSDNPFVAEYLRGQATPAPAEPEVAVAKEEVSLDIAEQLQDVAPEPEPVRKDDHPNFKALRLAAEKAERERDELMRLLHARETRESAPKSVIQPDEDDFGLGEDGYVEPKHLKKIYKEVKQLRQEAIQYKQQSAKQIAEAQLRLRYPDIDAVVSPENIQILNQTRPSYANILRNMSDDVYAQGEMAYQYMMDLGIHKSKAAAPEKDYAADKMRAINNSNKPRPLVSGNAKSESPLSKANAFAGQLNDSDMKRHYQEMMAAIERRD